MQQAVLDFGPYMVLANGFALAHAQPSELVTKFAFL
jgi:mannitol/fructose-specific phosphotransferase system IIA component (Ntr-type)